MAFGQSDPLERADVAAAEDGRTPLNTYTVKTVGYSLASRWDLTDDVRTPKVLANRHPSLERLSFPTRVKIRSLVKRAAPDT